MKHGVYSASSTINILILMIVIIVLIITVYRTVFISANEYANIILKKQCTLWICIFMPLCCVVGVDKYWPWQRLFILGLATVRKHAGQWTLYSSPLTFLTLNQQVSTQCQRLLLCEISSRSDQGFSSYRADMHTHTPSNTPTYIHRDKVFTISALPYYVVGSDKAINSFNGYTLNIVKGA